jgi:hypothetical protein
MDAYFVVKMLEILLVCIIGFNNVCCLFIGITTALVWESIWKCIALY